MFKKQFSSVQEILADFTTKVQQLQDLSSRKLQESVEHFETAADYTTRGNAAQQESQKAQAAANKISKFLED